MSIEVSMKMQAHLPRLSWCARYEPRLQVLRIMHGTDVETHGDFIVEGVWNGIFDSSGLIGAQHFFGSALLFRGDHVLAVPSRALVDRIVGCQHGDTLYVSNSLPVLLAASETRLDPGHDYGAESFSILRGIESYSTEFRLVGRDGSPIPGHQFFHYPVRVGPEGLESTDLAQEIPSFSSFEAYREYLTTVLGEIAENARSPRRSIRLRFRTTTSSGYDSTAVSVLAAELGTSVTYTRARSNSAYPAWLRPAATSDDGTLIARRLGYEVRYLDAPSRVDVASELDLLAATSAEPETALHSLARDIVNEDRPAVLFTGYHGDKVWDRRTSGDCLSPQLIRGDTSGLNLGEFRLSAGLVNVPVPFIGARAIADLVALSNSEEMRPWQLGNDYDRPIPRRIVEAAGVERHLFGVRKKAIVQTYLYPWNRRLRTEFIDWLQEEFDISPLRVKRSRATNAAAFAVLRTLQKFLGAMGKDRPDPVDRLGIAKILPQLMHQWAVGVLATRYAPWADWESWDAGEGSRRSH